MCTKHLGDSEEAAWVLEGRREGCLRCRPLGRGMGLVDGRSGPKGERSPVITGKENPLAARAQQAELQGKKSQRHL